MEEDRKAVAKDAAQEVVLMNKANFFDCQENATISDDQLSEDNNSQFSHHEAEQGGSPQNAAAEAAAASKTTTTMNEDGNDIIATTSSDAHESNGTEQENYSAKNDEEGIVVPEEDEREKEGSDSRSGDSRVNAVTAATSTNAPTFTITITDTHASTDAPAGMEAPTTNTETPSSIEMSSTETPASTETATNTEIPSRSDMDEALLETDDKVVDEATKEGIGETGTNEASANTTPTTTTTDIPCRHDEAIKTKEKVVGEATKEGTSETTSTISTEAPTCTGSETPTSTEIPLRSVLDEALTKAMETEVKVVDEVAKAKGISRTSSSGSSSVSGNSSDSSYDTTAMKADEAEEGDNGPMNKKGGLPSNNTSSDAESASTATKKSIPLHRLMVDYKQRKVLWEQEKRSVAGSRKSARPKKVPDLFVAEPATCFVNPLVFSKKRRKKMILLKERQQRRMMAMEAKKEEEEQQELEQKGQTQPGLDVSSSPTSTQKDAQAVKETMTKQIVENDDDDDNDEWEQDLEKKRQEEQQWPVSLPAINNDINEREATVDVIGSSVVADHVAGELSSPLPVVESAAAATPRAPLERCPSTDSSSSLKQQQQEGADAMLSMPGPRPRKSQKKSFNAEYVDKSFPEQLMQMLTSEAAPEAIWWIPGTGGKAFAIDCVWFRDIQMRHFFPGNPFSRITNCLKRWGFQRAYMHRLPEGILAFHHYLFLREMPGLVKCITLPGEKRKKKSDDVIKKRSSSKPTKHTITVAATTARVPAERSRAPISIARSTPADYKKLLSNRTSSQKLRDLAALDARPNQQRRQSESPVRRTFLMRNLRTDNSKTPPAEEQLPPSVRIAALRRSGDPECERNGRQRQHGGDPPEMTGTTGSPAARSGADRVPTSIVEALGSRSSSSAAILFQMQHRGQEHTAQSPTQSGEKRKADVYLQGSTQAAELHMPGRSLLHHQNRLNNVGRHSISFPPRDACNMQGAAGATRKESQSTRLPTNDSHCVKQSATIGIAALAARMRSAAPHQLYQTSGDTTNSRRHSSVPPNENQLKGGQTQRRSIPGTSRQQAESVPVVTPPLNVRDDVAGRFSQDRSLSAKKDNQHKHQPHSVGADCDPSNSAAAAQEAGQLSLKRQKMAMEEELAFSQRRILEQEQERIAAMMVANNEEAQRRQRLANALYGSSKPSKPKTVIKIKSKPPPSEPAGASSTTSTTTNTQSVASNTQSAAEKSKSEAASTTSAAENTASPSPHTPVKKAFKKSSVSGRRIPQAIHNTFVPGLLNGLPPPNINIPGAIDPLLLLQLQQQQANMAYYGSLAAFQGAAQWGSMPYQPQAGTANLEQLLLLQRLRR